MLDQRGQLLRAAFEFAALEIVMLTALLGASTLAFAQGWIGPAYVTRVVEGDLIYAKLDRRIETLRYLGIDVQFAGAVFGISMSGRGGRRSGSRCSGMPTSCLTSSSRCSPSTSWSSRR